VPTAAVIGYAAQAKLEFEKPDLPSYSMPNAPICERVAFWTSFVASVSRVRRGPMLRDERTPAARGNQRVLLPIIAVAAAIGIVGIVVKSVPAFLVGAVVVLLAGLVWRWA
jgi:hypothetical protein